MLIKDPYLQSAVKNVEVHAPTPPPPVAPIPPPISTVPAPSPYLNTSSYAGPQIGRHRAYSGNDANELQTRVRAYENELKSMEVAYNKQGEAARKLLNYNNSTREYHEAMKARNYQLNTRLQDAVTELQLNNHRHIEEQQRHTHDKDSLLTKYQEQTDELLRSRANCSALMEQKTRLEEQVSHLSFLIEKEAHQHELEIKEQILRTQSMDRTYKDLVSAKDEEISQLTGRLRLYQDENRKLNDINRTLQLTKDKGERIDNLSRIHHPQSNIKTAHKQNEDFNRTNQKELNDELKEQRTINEQMRKEMEQLRKDLQALTLKESQGLGRQQKEKHNEDHFSTLQKAKWQGMVSSVSSLRDGIAKEMFELFVKSVGEGEKKKSNSLVIFIENWKCLDMQRLLPYVQSYFQARDGLKQLAESKEVSRSVHYPKMRETIPLSVGSQPHRNNLNQWILSTIQFTKNQRNKAKPSLNNWLLFLFRLLTIQYRVRYPMQGKSYQLDKDVVNELHHELVKGVEGVLEYQ